MTGLQVIERDANGMPVRQRAGDGYVNATQLCKAAGKRFNDYTSAQPTKDFLGELSAETGIAVSELVQTRKGGDTANQGSWVHPDVAIHLAQWCSPKFAVMVSRWVRELLAAGHVSIDRSELRKVISDEVQAVLSRLTQKPVDAFPRFSVQERLRYRGRPLLDKKSRAKIRRVANVLIREFCSEWPDVSDTSGGGATLYYGSMLYYLDAAIDRFFDELRRPPGPNLFSSMN
jgi:hypothetical protein